MFVCSVAFTQDAIIMLLMTCSYSCCTEFVDKMASLEYNVQSTCSVSNHAPFVVLGQLGSSCSGSAAC